jgi:hypothetical protein
VTHQLNWVISEHQDEVVAEFTKQRGRAPATPEEAEEWWSALRMAEVLWGPRGQWPKHHLRTIDGGKNEEGPFDR